MPVHLMNCIAVKVIFVSKFENTWHAHSVNFENELENGRNILFSYIGYIMIELFMADAANKLRRRSPLHFIFPQNISTINDTKTCIHVYTVL